jgi:hypothetical protein
MILDFVTFSGSDYRYEVFAFKYIPYVSLYLMLTLQKFTVMAKKLCLTMPFFSSVSKVKSEPDKKCLGLHSVTAMKKKKTFSARYSLSN